MGIADLQPARPAIRRSGAALSLAGLEPGGVVHWNLTPPELYEHAVRRGEGQIIEHGPFCAVTTPHTGRSPGDKFIIKEAESEGHVAWGKVNQPMTPEHFARLRRRKFHGEYPIFIFDRIQLGGRVNDVVKIRKDRAIAAELHRIQGQVYGQPQSLAGRERQRRQYHAAARRRINHAQLLLHGIRARIHHAEHRKIGWRNQLLRQDPGT